MNILSPEQAAIDEEYQQMQVIMRTHFTDGFVLLGNQAVNYAKFDQWGENFCSALAFFMSRNPGVFYEVVRACGLASEIIVSNQMTDVDPENNGLPDEDDGPPPTLET